MATVEFDADESRRVMEMVALEWERRRRMTRMYLLLLGAPLLAAGVAVAYSTSMRNALRGEVSAEVARQLAQRPAATAPGDPELGKRVDEARRIADAAHALAARNQEELSRYIRDNAGLPGTATTAKQTADAAYALASNNATTLKSYGDVAGALNDFKATEVTAQSAKTLASKNDETLRELTARVEKLEKQRPPVAQPADKRLTIPGAIDLKNLPKKPAPKPKVPQ